MSNLLGAAVVYTGLMLVVPGLVFAARPVPRLGLTRRRTGAAIVASGLVVALLGMLIPARDTRAVTRRSHLDEWMPAWQFREHHTRRIAAPPSRVIDAIRGVRADEIALFRTLTWIRRGGRRQAPGILDAGDSLPLLDVATRNGFIWLADDSTRELVVGTLISAPRGARRPVNAQLFRDSLPTGFTIAAMNFIVEPLGADSSLVSTETRVYSNGTAARRRFGAYWRVIYPGSALIRRGWLRAVDERARRAADPMPGTSRVRGNMIVNRNTCETFNLSDTPRRVG